MKFLRITAAAGTRSWISESALVLISTAADTTSADTAMASGRITRGPITQVKYLDGINAAVPTLVVVSSIPAYNGTNDLYEFGCLSPDGSFQVILSNRAVNF